MNGKYGTLPQGSNEKIVIKQEEYIKKFGCITCDYNECDFAFCNRCAYSTDIIEFRNKK